MAYPDQPASPGMTSPRRMANRNTNRYSVTALFSMAAEQDVEVEDDLARGSCFSGSSYLNDCNGEKKNSSEASARLEGQNFCSV